MPKERRSSSLDRCRASPYSRCQTNPNKRKPKSPSLPIGTKTDWEETRCPICIDHPHNAVLLLCSSREKGCLPYMCDTSSRHSNCLDQFRKSTTNADVAPPKLVCPLCRGQVNGWIVVNPARQIMDSKTRSCSVGTCEFVGNYSQLRKHARCQHPGVRPTAVDPERELEWRNLEEDVEQQDIMNMQFEFDDDEEEELMDGVAELASPMWDPDLDFMNFLSTFESEFDSVFPEIDWDSEDSSLFFDDWDNMFAFSSPNEPEIRDPVRSRTGTRTRDMSSARPSENNPLTTITGTRTRGRQRSNSQPSSRDRQEQVTTLVDFHEFSSNLP